LGICGIFPLVFVEKKHTCQSRLLSAETGPGQPIKPCKSWQKDTRVVGEPYKQVSEMFLSFCQQTEKSS